MTAGIPSPWGSITAVMRKGGAVRYRLRGRIEGKLESFGTFETISDAQRRAAAIKAQLSGISKGLTLRGWGHDWMDSLELDGQRSIDDKRGVWDRYIENDAMADMLIRRVTAVHVRRWLHDLGQRRVAKGRRKGLRLSEQTVKNGFYLLRGCLGAAFEAGHINANPAMGLRVRRQPTTDDPWTFLDVDEVRLVLAGQTSEGPLPLFQHVVFTVAIFTGMRQGELWGLRWKDVRLNARQPHIVVRYSRNGPTKGGRPREVPLLPPALDALKRWRQTKPGIGTALVFSRFEKGVVTGSMFSKGYHAAWADRRARKLRKGGEEVLETYPGWSTKLGIRRHVRFHDLRHTCASHLVMGTWGRAWRLEEVRQILGHRSITTTERYAHLAPEAIRGAAEDAFAVWKL